MPKPEGQGTSKVCQSAVSVEVGVFWFSRA